MVTVAIEFNKQNMSVRLREVVDQARLYKDDILRQIETVL